MKIDVVRPRDLTGEDIAAWVRLQGDGVLRSPFLTPYWVQAVERAGGPDATGARVAILRDAGAAVGFLPVRKGRFTALPLGAPLSDYQGLVAAADIAIDPRQLTNALGVQRIDFSSLLVEAPGLGGCARGQAVSHVMDLTGGYDAYGAGRAAAGTDILKDCAKKRRKLEREVGEVVFTAESASSADFEALVAWKRSQYAETRQTDVLGRGWTMRLLRDLHDRRDPELRGVLFTLHAGGKLAAAHYALVTQRVAHAWFIAHDCPMQRYSPGVILITEVARWAAEQGLAELDLGPGDYRFKVSLANRQRPVAHGYIGRLSPATLVRAAEYRVRQAAEALPLGRYSALPGKAMRRLDVWRGLGNPYSSALSSSSSAGPGM
jgi:CelD/BcsL family acetyltransferase involved in cellulose biosynthesis